MKKINDTKIYLSIIIAPLVIAAAIGGVSLYSKLVVEPKVKTLISSETTMKEGYLVLREPQIFGGYKYWDSDGMAVKNSLRYFDKKLFNGGEITSDERIYLELILKRRISGSELGIKSAFFLLIVSLAGFIAYIIEIRKGKSI
ncbi:MAG TPA: hypothetical protein PLY36_05495 [Spirochaetota bacterium]|nr:hypothetical protein [Spirochaetota bacterium]